MSAAAIEPVLADAGTRYQSGRDMFNGNVINGDVYTGTAAIGRNSANIPDRCFEVPFRQDPNFITRTKIFDKLETSVKTKRPAVLCGLGGTGKSQIAIEYAWRFKEQYPDSYVIWIFCATRDTILHGCTDVARNLKLPGLDDDSANACQVLTEWLKTLGRRDPKSPKWLLVLDNVDYVSLLTQPLVSTAFGSSHSHLTESQPLLNYLPLQHDVHQQILVTSRSEDVAAALGIEPISVGVFTRGEALELFRTCLSRPSDETATLELLETLGYLPLAITQAAAYIKRNRKTVQSYSLMLKDSDQQMSKYLTAELQDPHRDSRWPNSVFRTWKLSFAQIQKDQPLAAKVLAIMACFRYKLIPLVLLLRVEQEAEDDIEMALGTIYGYSLAELDDDEELIKIHALVGASVRFWLQQEGQFLAAREQALLLLATTMPSYYWKDTEDHLTQYKRYRTLSPLVPGLLVHNDSHQRERGHLLTKLAAWESHDGMFNASLDHARAADAAYTAGSSTVTLTDKVEPLTLIAANLYNLRRFGEAEDFLKEIMQKHKSLLDLRHLLVKNLIAQSKISEAERLCREALKEHQDNCKEEDMSNIHMMIRLANIQQHQGQSKEARELFERVLVQLKRFFPDARDERVQAQRGLAWLLLQDGGDATRAVALIKAIVSEVTAATDFPPTQKLYVQFDLARALSHAHKHAVAQKVFRTLIDTGEEILGIDAPNVRVWRSERDNWEDRTGSPLPLRNYVCGNVGNAYRGNYA